MGLQPKALRLHFTKETKNEMKDVIRLYDDIFVKDMPTREPDIEFTRGHFKRGVK